MSQRTVLRACAQETLDTISSLEKQLGSRKITSSRKSSFESLPRLDPNHCPSYPRPATITVVNEDTLNAALRLRTHGGDARRHDHRPVVVNFASHKHPGGGWLNGAVAQEEAICYRTSLAASLRRSNYPLKMDEGIYSPHVLILRDDMASGHRLLVPQTPANELPVISAMTIAAIHKPKIRRFLITNNPRPRALEKKVFARDKDRGITKAKMRLALRMAATNGHRSLVLGALGCGAFGNPAEDVAHCWLEVLKEDEFAGNWWKDVCFAVYDPKQDGNYDVFRKVLAGKTA